MEPDAIFSFLVADVLLGHLFTEDVRFFPLTR